MSKDVFLNKNLGRGYVLEFYEDLSNGLHVWWLRDLGGSAVAGGSAQTYKDCLDDLVEEYSNQTGIDYGRLFMEVFSSQEGVSESEIALMEVLSGEGDWEAI